MDGKRTLRGNDWTASEHCEDYSRHVKARQSLLQTIWDDLEVSPEEQSGRLLEAGEAARSAWDDAVHTAERQRDGLKEAVAESERRLGKIRAELSDEVFPAEEIAEGCGKSLRAEYERVDGRLRLWLDRRAQRQQRYQGLKDKCARLREQLGIPGSSVPVNSVTLYAIDGAALELQKLEAEAVERRHRLEVGLKELRRTCLELGEDEGGAAASVHPSLGDSRDAQSSEQDLSERTLSGLREKTLELQDVARRRAEQGEVLLQTLRSLWDALEVPAGDVERELFTRLLEGPSRLHDGSIQKVTREIGRLEGERRELMLSLIQSKRHELAAACASSHLAVPELPETAAEVGEVADLLARTVKQLGAARAEAIHRREPLRAIQVLNAALTEDEWLAQYEADPNKYKGRDSTRNIQRAIVAQEHRRQLPAVLGAVEDALLAFSTSQHKPFRYDGRDYQIDILVPLKRQLGEEGERRAQAARAKPAPNSARKTLPGPGTPRRPNGPRLRASQDGASGRKPALPPTPASERRRRTEGGGISRTTSALSRTESNASWCESEVAAPNGLSERMSRLLQAAVSPPVSRTASGTSEADRERAIYTPGPKVSLEAKLMRSAEADGPPLLASGTGLRTEIVEDQENRNTQNLACH